MKQELSVLYKLFVHHHPSLSSRVEEERVKTSFCQRNFSVGRAERRIEWKTRAYFSQGPSRLVPPENARARTPRIFSSTFHLSRSADCAQRCIGYHRMGALRWKMWASLSFFCGCARVGSIRERNEFDGCVSLTSASSSCRARRCRRGGRRRPRGCRRCGRRWSGRRPCRRRCTASCRRGT